MVFEPVHQEGGSTRDTETLEDFAGADSCEITGSATAVSAKIGQGFAWGSRLESANAIERRNGRKFVVVEVCLAIGWEDGCVVSIRSVS